MYFNSLKPLWYFLSTATDCIAATAPVHGSSNITGTIAVGQHQHFSCNHGYVLSGPANLKCLSGGQFDNQTRPSCIGKFYLTILDCVPLFLCLSVYICVSVCLLEISFKVLDC